MHWHNKSDLNKLLRLQTTNNTAVVKTMSSYPALPVSRELSMWTIHCIIMFVLIAEPKATSHRPKSYYLRLLLRSRLLVLYMLLPATGVDISQSVDVLLSFPSLNSICYPVISGFEQCMTPEYFLLSL